MSATGTWNITVQTPLGPQEFTAHFDAHGDALKGRLEGSMGSEEVNGTIDGDQLTWSVNVQQPMQIQVDFDVVVDGDRLNGDAKLGMFGSAPVTGERA
ncbi:MAG: hypothetical protein ABW164_06580 [Sphingobium sp.]